jgi:hypothetical protein
VAAASKLQRVNDSDLKDLNSNNMVDESTLGVPLFTGILVIISLCIISYKGVDPLVSHILSSMLLVGTDQLVLQLGAIPTIGFSDPILSYLSAFRFTIMGGAPMLIEGYQKVTITPQLSARAKPGGV